jgi:pyridoxine 5-phosphate synthase
MTKLSVNINKVATLRNARWCNVPDVVKVALDCEKFGAEGITVHPRRMNGTSQEQMYMP